ncbi:MAG: transcriptional repressor [Armatimonadetes bacterium]|nr:transcriptional repressor [Armatimonadota bacterium]
MTRQRVAIVDLLDNAADHLDAKKLLEQAKRRVPDIDKTTVYRTIRRLRQLGLIDELDLLHFRHDGHFYELAPDKMHLHIVCTGCGQVREASPQAWADVEREIQAQTGYTIEMARCEVGGYCPECQKKR